MHRDSTHCLWRVLFALLTSMALVVRVQADWPQFRGPAGNGIASERQAPTRWNQETNIKWKVKLPQPGNGSPIVSGRAVFVACAEDSEGKQRSLYCYDRITGKQLWKQTVDFGRKMPTHKTNPYCGSTPAANGERVVVWHASAGLHCYDFAGTPIWSRDLGEFRHIWGYGTSPVIVGDRVILHSGPGAKVFVAAFDLQSGKTIWETPEPVDHIDDGYNREKHYEGSWTTPVIVNRGDQTLAVCSMPTRVVAYDVETGKIVFWCNGIRGPRGDLAYSSPMIEGDRCVAIGGFNGPAIGFRLVGTGDITAASRLWRNESNPQSIGTGVFWKGHVYRINAARPAPIECLNPDTGKVIWASDPRGGICWGSLVAVGSLGYVTNREGTTFVFRLTPEKYIEVARNPLGETCNATPAVSAGRIYIRTWKHLYCIEGEGT